LPYVGVCDGREPEIEEQPKSSIRTCREDMEETRFAKQKGHATELHLRIKISEKEATV